MVSGCPANQVRPFFMTLACIIFDTDKVEAVLDLQARPTKFDDFLPLMLGLEIIFILEGSLQQRLMSPAKRVNEILALLGGESTSAAIAACHIPTDPSKTEF